ncbi:MAG: hypothetical protein ING75_13410 [Rhodocyclaceae bacterium]|nr:hypothetical protein [Rhodocyclaceae bacterium]
MVTDEEVATSLRNVAAYAPDTYRLHGAATIAAVLRANDFRVRGHASGSAGGGQNAATSQDLETLAGYLRAYKPPSAEPAVAASSSSGPSKRHSAEAEAAAAARKEALKKDKAAKKKAAYDAKKDPFGKKRLGGGGAGGPGNTGGGGIRA